MSLSQQNEASVSGQLRGPKYLRQHLTVPETGMADKYKIKYPTVQWAGQLISTTQNRWFKIKYYGNLLDETIIVNTDESVQKVIAVDVASNEEILLFDKTIHGWDGFVCGLYEEYKGVNRSTDKVFTSPVNTGVFKILFIAYYNDGTQEELQDLANAEGLVELHNGATFTLPDALDDAFDALVVYAVDEKGNRFEIINESLA